MKRLRHKQHGRARSFVPPGSLRGKLFTVIFLIAFSMQSYVAATHVHEIAPPPAELTNQLVQSSVEVNAPAKADHNRVPVRDSRDDCPLCRAVVHAGAFLFPTLLIVEIPDEGVVLASLATVFQPVTGTLSHSWSSRGPPQH